MTKTIKQAISILFRYQKVESIYFVFLLGLAVILEGISIAFIFPIVQIIVSSETSPYLKFFEEILPFNLEINPANLILLVIFIYGFKTFYLLFFAWWRNNFIAKLNINLNLFLYKNYLRKEFEDITRVDTSIILRNSFDIVRNLTGAIESILQLFVEIFTFIIILILLVYYDASSTSNLILTISIIVLAYIALTKNLLFSWAKKKITLTGKIFKSIRETFSMIRFVKLKSKESYFYTNFKNAIVNFHLLNRNFSFFKEIPKNLLELIAIFLLGLVPIFQLQDESSIIDILPILGIYAAAALRIIPGVSRVLSLSQLIYHTGPSVQLLFPELINKNQSIDNLNFGSKKIKKTDFESEITFNNVSYKYPDKEKFAIKNLNFTLKKKDFICIIGETGIGKSTFVDLITGLIRPQEGIIKFDNKNIQDHLNDWHNLISLVPQRTVLVNDTIKKNITLQINDYDNELKIKNAAKYSRLDKFIDKNDVGLDYLVGEDTKGLSGGQAQRIAIARCLYDDPEILIFDEITSALDKDTSEELIKTFLNVLKDKTVIFITHSDLITVKADSVYKLETKEDQTSLTKIK
jgi:ABC-type bacteriocin/lantibiotic exporter with double-glycine peptidase domain